MTDLNELQVFVQVAKWQSFTTAAERLDLPKSSVSRSLRRLEQRLGVQLIERSTRRVALTEEGQIYFDRCERVLEEAEQAEIAIGALQATPRGTLRVGAPAIFARSLLGPALAEFLAMYPDVRLHLLSLDGLSRERQLDVMVRPGPLDDSGMLVRPLFKIRTAVYASPLYLRNRVGLDSPAALRHHSCIVTNCWGFSDINDAAIWRLQRGLEVKEVRVEARVSVPDPAISQQLALTGVGVAILAQSAVRHHVEGGRLIRLLPDWEPEPVELHALYASRLQSSPKVRAFVQFMKQRLGADPLGDLAPTSGSIGKSIQNSIPALNGAN